MTVAQKYKVIKKSVVHRHVVIFHTFPLLIKHQFYFIQNKKAPKDIAMSMAGLILSGYISFGLILLPLD